MADFPKFPRAQDPSSTALHYAATEVAGEVEHSEPSAFGFDATMLVALAMLCVIALAIWKKVPAMVVGMLDKRIAEIREQLDEARQLRADAEALKAEYVAKAAAASADADAMRANAIAEARLIIAKGEADAAILIARRQKMAEEKISAAERAAVVEIRSKAAGAAARAAAVLIAEHHGAEPDARLVDSAIARLN